MIYAGIDAGSRAIKIVLLEQPSSEGPSRDGQPGQGQPGDGHAGGPHADGKAANVRAWAASPQGPQPARQAQEFYQRVLAEQGLAAGDIACAVATGYARAGVTAADTTITEITCHAAGVHHLLPQVRTIIEIGGQDSKLLRLGAGGTVRDFAMNDRCAAGTGRFLELVAARLDCSISALGELSDPGAHPAAISSMCAVFAETEIIGLLASGCGTGEIVAGAQAAIASRIVAMAGGEVEAPVAFTGGVAMVAGMDKALSAALGKPVVVPPRPQFTGALGAALLAARQK